MTQFKLDVRHLTKRYGSVTALESADLQVEAGEFVTLLGPSGSGKTTLLSIVAGLRQPSAGEVWIDGRLSTYAPSYRRDLGMVFQNYALFPHMSVAENIAFPLKMRTRLGEAEIRRKVGAVLDAVRLASVENRMPAELSGGQQQRVALARCLVYEPSIILMDEPLGALDKNLREELQLEIKALHTRLGITVLYVTHDQEEAMTMSDRICLMNNARIEQVGSPLELYGSPRTLFAARFFGESNLFEGQLVRSGRQLAVEGEWGRIVLGNEDQSMAVGDRAIAMIRPERVRLLPGGADECDNTVPATVEQVIFNGGVSKCYLRDESGHPIIVTHLTDAAGPQLSAGDQVRAGWDANATVLLAT